MGHISGMVGPVDVNHERCASVRHLVNYVTLTFDLIPDLHLGFLKVKLRNSCISGIVILLMWNEKKENQVDTGSTVWPCTLTTPITLTLIFQGQILEQPYFRNARADWHGTKGMLLDHSLPWRWYLGKHDGVVDVSDSDRGDFRRRHAVDISSCFLFGVIPIFKLMLTGH